MKAIRHPKALLVSSFCFLLLASAAWAMQTADTDSTPEKTPIRSPEMAANGSAEELEAAKRQGAETAAQDIKAGVLRILYYGKPFPTGKPLVDAGTGYCLQIVGGCSLSNCFVAEVDAYNQAMCDWHAKNSPKKK